MGEKAGIFGIIIILILGVGYGLSRVVQLTGPVIWIDRSNIGSWKHDKNAGAWWDELSLINSNTVEEKRRVAVYLLPELQMSQTAFGRRDQPPTLYADWRVWGKMDVLTISVNWEEWEMIEADERQKRLAEFVAKQLGEYWGVRNKEMLEMTRKVLAGTVEPPVTLTWKQREEQ